MLNHRQYKHLFDEHFDALRSYIYYRISDEDVATDYAQDVFLTLWEKRAKWNDMSHLKSLLYKMASDLIVTHYRKGNTQAQFEQHLQVQVNEHQETPESTLEYSELTKRIADALATMNEGQRVAFLMNREEGLTYREIAERLDISEKAVEKRLSNALKWLRQHVMLLALVCIEGVIAAINNWL